MKRINVTDEKVAEILKKHGKSASILKSVLFAYFSEMGYSAEEAQKQATAIVAEQFTY